MWPTFAPLAEALALLPAGVYQAGTSRCRWCALTAPLHPCLCGGHGPLPSAVCFCGTVLTVSRTGRYPAGLAIGEPGLSSTGSLFRGWAPKTAWVKRRGRGATDGFPCHRRRSGEQEGGGHGRRRRAMSCGAATQARTARPIVALGPEARPVAQACRGSGFRPSLMTS